MPRAKKIKIDFAALPTEKTNPRTRNLDELSIAAILKRMNREDETVPKAVAKLIPRISDAVEIIVAAIRSGGKLFLMGAGTSGRLAVMEAAECPPTFHTPPSLVQAIMAGGRSSVFRSQEGAEDDSLAGRLEIHRQIRKGDVLIGIAASGVTAFVRAGLEEAKKRGAKTILLTCNPKIRKLSYAEVVIAVQTGPEVISGSTRLKAGTATKLVLNMLTVASMVRLGKVYENRMVDLMPRSRKLNARAIRLIGEIGRVGKRQAEKYFREAQGHAKLAIVMARKKIGVSEARRALEKTRGFLKPILARRNS